MATTINNKEHWWAATKGLLGHNKRVDGKELQEDFLKYIYERGKEMTRMQVDEAAKDLGTNREGMANIVGALALAGELAANDTLALTEKGCMHALRLIRAHRIYEQYLAEHSGYAPSEWHERAHRMEHRITPDEQERIASLLGNPLFDPHGDPIPTPSLAVVDKAASGEPVEAQSWWRITHVEDDDKQLFTLIAEKGLTKDSLIFITQIDNLAMLFDYEGEHFSLPITALEAINMRPITAAELASMPEAQAQRLVHLKAGEQARIVGLSPACRGALRRRLLDLGFVKGSVVSIDMPSPMGNPIAYVVRGSAIALRHEQAKYVLVRKDLVEDESQQQ